MSLLVKRLTYSDESTQGELYVDDVFEAFTLEPRKDQSKGKPYCIPAGTYEVILQYSPRFRMTTPHVLDVPGFTAIEIHPGNRPGDTEGCLLVGQEKLPDFVGNSRRAFQQLMTKIVTATTITYIG